nr:cobaltochelatase subunit CobN [Natronospira proteinivora]
MIFAVFVLLLLGGYQPAWGKTVVGVVSERSAAEVAAGAHRFLEEVPESRIQLRTPEQIAEMADSEVRDFLGQGDAIFLAAVFGDQVSRLQRLVQEGPVADGKPILAINSDRRITRLSRLGGEAVLDELDADELSRLTANPAPGEDPEAHLAEQRQTFSRQSEWLKGRAFYMGRSPEHMSGLMAWLLSQAGHSLDVPEPSPREAVRYYRDGESFSNPEKLDLDEGPAVVLLDLDRGDRPGDRALLDNSCEAVEARGMQCFAVLARWGGGSREAVETLTERMASAELTAVVSLQFFAVGGGEGRQAVTEAFENLDVPVIKGIRLAGSSEEEWRLSLDGIPQDQVYFRVAMPELQGISQPQVLAVAEPPQVDPQTGIHYVLTQPLTEQVAGLADRLKRWQRLRAMDNSEKRVAMVYYNHPPGRHNIGADKLDVPESLMELLRLMKAAGYDTGPLPEDAEALLDKIQDRGINATDDGEQLARMHGQVASLSASDYQQYFETLPEVIQGELQHGPLGYLHARLEAAYSEAEHEHGRRLLERTLADLRHLVENHQHEAQERALSLLDQYEAAWSERLAGRQADQDPESIRDALVRTGMPGLSGWGAPPGEAMVHEGEMLFPGIRFGNVFIGPQPPRGWEIRESLLHANTSFPPTHQYVGFYHWIRDHFEADALAYIGRHSTREFLPRRRVGLGDDDYPALLGGDLPVIYPYIVDGVGEGIQAKRRAMAVIVSHLTPPLATTELYDELLELRQLVETYESATDPDSPTRRRAAETLRDRIEALELTDVIEREIADDLGVTVSEVSLEEVSESLLVHEAGHYVTHMQEHFMPLGLHVFGRDWDEEALETMLKSMAGDGEVDAEAEQALRDSPAAEAAHFLGALSGRFVPPGQGNDPIRTPQALPTGTNFHALSSDLIPTRIAWRLGQELAAEARDRGAPEADGSEALVLWASDTVRDEGAMVAFGLDMMGLTPEWNSRGIVSGVARQDLETLDRPRQDVLFTTSGLFRDLYADQLVLLDQAVKVALDGAYETIQAEYPALQTALDASLEELPESMRDPGSESLAMNRVAAQWVEDTRGLIAQGMNADKAGRQASLRIFGTAPGAYGAGITRLTERSSAWEDRDQLAEAYVRRMGHAYGMVAQGEPAHAAFDQRLSTVGRTYLGRASHIYALLDRDDAFDFQGGLSLAVEKARGEAPANRVLMHADPDNPYVDSLERALLTELRARNLNPQWLQPLMDHGYAGARTMGRDFLDNLWGWQVTAPEVIDSWVWDEVHAVYLEDRHGLGLDEFLAQDHNVHVKTHMQSVMLVAAHRGYWEADAQVLADLQEDFAALVAEHGLPGSGHSRPDHPTMDWVADQIDPELREAFEARLDAARMEQAEAETDPARVMEIAPRLDEASEDIEASDQDSAERDEGAQSEQDEGQEEGPAQSLYLWAIVAVALLLLIGGILTGRRGR